jgi:hypothetical protein
VILGIFIPTLPRWPSVPTAIVKAIGNVCPPGNVLADGCGPASTGEEAAIRRETWPIVLAGIAIFVVAFEAGGASYSERAIAADRKAAFLSASGRQVRLFAANAPQPKVNTRVDGLHPLAATAVGPGDHLKVVAVGIAEVNAPPAVIVVDLARPAAARIRPVVEAPILDASEDSVEVRLTDQEA